MWGGMHEWEWIVMIGCMIFGYVYIRRVRQFQREQKQVEESKEEEEEEEEESKSVVKKRKKKMRQGRIRFTNLDPPATMPICALTLDGTVFFPPDGRRRRVVPLSSSWVTTMAKVPLHRAKEPRSPRRVSILQTMVPSGTWLSGKTFPTLNAAFFPQ